MMSDLVVKKVFIRGRLENGRFYKKELVQSAEVSQREVRLYSSRTTEQIREALKDLHKGGWSITEEEPELGRRADIVARHVAGFVVAYEIKSHTEDLYNDLRKWEKSLPWRLKSDQFYFAMPAYVYSGLKEVTRETRFPPGSGVVLWHGGTDLRVERIPDPRWKAI